MKFLHLIVRNAFRNRLRTALTVGGSAFLIFVLIFMMTALTEMMAWEGQAATHLRVAVQHSAGLATFLPIELEGYLQSEAIAGRAEYVSKLNWFGGFYQDPKQFFANFAVDHRYFRQLWDEYKLPPEDYARWCATKSGAVMGESLARKFGLRRGQRFTLTGTIYPCNPDLELVGIWKSDSVRDEEVLFLRWDYFDELMKNRKLVGTFWLKARTAQDIPILKQTIDDHTKNSSDPTETMTEKEFNVQFMQMMGNVRGLVFNVGIMVLVIMVLMTANTMAMSARERVTEIAVMRTLGFTRGRIVFMFVAEAVLVAIVGAGMALGVALVLFNGFKLSPVPNFFPYFLVETVTIGVALATAVLAGLLSSAIPAVRSARRTIVEGLRQVV